MDPTVQDQPDVVVYSVGNIVTIVAIAILLAVGLIWVIGTHRITRQWKALQSVVESQPTSTKSSLPISYPITPPQGSILRWDHYTPNRKSSRYSPGSSDGDRERLLATPKSTYITPERRRAAPLSHIFTRSKASSTYFALESHLPSPPLTEKTMASSQSVFSFQSDKAQVFHPTYP